MQNDGMLVVQEKSREAPVHFELYRFIKNCVESRRRAGLTDYSEVRPEKDVGSGTADLVIERTGLPTAFLVIEVKKKTPQSMLVFDDEPQKQAEGYASKLNAHFYAISDGDALRLFRTKSKEPLGGYSINLSEEFAKTLLEGLADIDVGKSSSLPFGHLEPPFERVRQMTSELGKVFLNIFDDLSANGTVKLEQKGWVKHVYVGDMGAIFRLGLYPAGEKEDYIDVRLELLRKAFKERFAEVVTNLSHVPAFNWIKEGNWEKEPIKWRYLKSIAAQNPDLDQTTRDLKDCKRLVNAVARMR
jgi:hypothetical protein